MPDLPHRRASRRGVLHRRVAALLLCAAVVLGLALSASGGASGPPPPAPPTAPAGELTVVPDSRHPGRPVAARYLGLSFEASSAGQLAALAGRGDLVALLRSLGPGLLRLGGASADTRTAWHDARTPVPSWASAVVDPETLRGIARLASRSGWRVLLTIGLVHFDVRSAAREAAAARAILGPRLAAIEIGNEPDSYARHKVRAPSWGRDGYEAEVSAYRRAIARSAPGIPLAGPGVSGSLAFQRWGPAEVRAQHPLLLTGHHYPLRCDAVPAPSPERLLSAETRALEIRSLARYLGVARASSIRFRMDETNTVSCGGRPGVSNVFASALWAIGYAGQTLAAGASGLNLQGNLANCLGYSPLCAPTPAALARGELRAQPEWYGLLLLRSLQGMRPLPARLISQTPANVVVAAFAGAHGARRFLLADDEPPGAPPTRIHLRVGGAAREASVLTLAARSPSATSGVTLGGAAVSAAGAWHPSSRLPRLAVRGGVVTITLAPSRAALVSLPASGR